MQADREARELTTAELVALAQQPTPPHLQPTEAGASLRKGLKLK